MKHTKNLNSHKPILRSLLSLNSLLFLLPFIELKSAYALEAATPPKSLESIDWNLEGGTCAGNPKYCIVDKRSGKGGQENGVYVNFGGIGDIGNGGVPDNQAKAPIQGWNEKYVNPASPEGESWAIEQLVKSAAAGGKVVVADFDNFDGFTSGNNDGFGNNANAWIAKLEKVGAKAHSLGISFPLKNTPELAAQLASKTDFALDESGYKDGFMPQIVAAFKPLNKLIFNTEYGKKDDALCLRAQGDGVTLVFHPSKKVGKGLPCSGGVAILPNGRPKATDFFAGAPLWNGMFR